MKKLFIRILLFATAVVAIDLAYGIVMDYLNSHAKGGGVAKRYYISKKSNEEILLFGSSRMAHHYNPLIIQDSIGMTCYNCGEDGNGVILSFGFLEMITKRYKPKLIIYDLSEFDLFVSDNTKFTSLLKPFCDDQDVLNVISDVSPMDRYKLKSNLYKYNSLVISMLGCYVKPTANINGFIPLQGTMSYDPVVKQPVAKEIDSVKMKYLDAFVEKCKDSNIQIVFCISPTYKGVLFKEQYDSFYHIAEKYDVPFWNFIDHEVLSKEKQYYKDSSHLNEKGAELYTNLVINKIRELKNTN